MPEKQGTTTTRIHETEVERTQESQREQGGQQQGGNTTPREGTQQGDQRPPAGSPPETV